MTLFKKNLDQLASIKADNAKLLEKVQELEAKVKEAEDTANNMAHVKLDWDKNTEALKAEHAKALETIKADYEAKLKVAAENTAALVASTEALKKEHEDKISALKSEYDAKAVKVEEEVSKRVASNLASTGLPVETASKPIEKPAKKPVGYTIIDHTGQGAE